jgi:N utilization substance protein B
MEMKKREVREGAFILYFEKLFRDDTIDEIYEITLESGDIGENLRISEKSRSLAAKIDEKADELDKIIANYSKKRSIDRIAKINLAILRLGLYEAAYEDKIPVNVAISEAVALAEKYALEQDVAFINGVLGSYSRSVSGSADKSADSDE